MTERRTSRPRPHRGELGLTLLELLIALAIISIAFLAVAAAQIGNLRASAEARDVAEAKTLANRVIQDVQRDVVIEVLAGADATARRDLFARYAGRSNSNPITDGCRVAPTTFPDTPSPNGNCQGTAEAAGGLYAAQWVVGPLSGPTPVNLNDEGLAVVRVQVDWIRSGIARSMSFESIISCLDLIEDELCPDPRKP